MPAIKYRFAEDGYESSIEDGKEKYTSCGKTAHGNTAWTRFFGRGEVRKYIVKKPKSHLNHFQLNDLGKEAIAKFKQEYEHELQIWNQVHPQNQASLITSDAGLRLVLPCLPGNALSDVLAELPCYAQQKEDQITLCQIALAVFEEFKRFYQLGFAHDDFSEDNVLVEKNNDGSYRAYLIDLDDVCRRNDTWITNSEWPCLNSLLERIPYVNDYYAEAHHGYLNLRKIDNVQSEVDALVKLNELKNALPVNKPTLIQVKNSLPNKSDYFIYGCLDDGQWNFTKIDDNIIRPGEVIQFSGDLTDNVAAEVCSKIHLQKCHVSYRLELHIACLEKKLEELSHNLRLSF